MKGLCRPKLVERSIVTKGLAHTNIERVTEDATGRVVTARGAGGTSSCDTRGLAVDGRVAGSEGVSTGGGVVLLFVDHGVDLRTTDHTRVDGPDPSVVTMHAHEVGDDVLGQKLERDQGTRSGGTVLVEVEVLTLALDRLCHRWNHASGIDLTLVARVAAVEASDGHALAVVGNTGGWEETDGSSAVHGTLKLAQIVWSREWLFDTSNADLVHIHGVFVWHEEARTAERSLLHDRRVSELLHKGLAALNRRVRDLGVLVRAVADPTAAFDLVEHGNHATNVREVDERVPDVVSRLEIDAKVDEVVRTEADLVKKSFERQL